MGKPLSKGGEFDMSMYKKVMIATCVLLVITVIMTVMGNKEKDDILPVYTDASDAITSVNNTESTQTVDYEANIYVDNQVGFSIEIPNDWKHVESNGEQSFIHVPSNSALKIRTSAYDPSVNRITDASASASVSEKGFTYVGMQFTSNSSYELSYQDYKDSTYDYIEEVQWDRDSIVTITCVFNDMYYDKMIPYYEKILSTFAWEKKNPIPEGFYLYYDDIMRCEIGVPEGWSVGTSDNTIYITDDETGASIAIVAAESSTTSLSGLRANDMASYVANGRDGYIMSSFSTSTDSAVASGTYINNNIQLQCCDYLRTGNGMLYSISMSYENGRIDRSVMDTCIDMFRSF